MTYLLHAVGVLLLSFAAYMRAVTASRIRTAQNRKDRRMDVFDKDGVEIDASVSLDPLELVLTIKITPAVIGSSAVSDIIKEVEKISPSLATRAQTVLSSVK